MNSIQRIASTARLAGARQMSSAKITPELAKLRAKQEFFQIADGKMIHEKTAFDRALFAITSIGVLVGMGMSFKFYYDFSFPKRG